VTLRRPRPLQTLIVAATPGGEPAGFHWRRRWRMVARIERAYTEQPGWAAEQPVDRRYYTLATRDGLLCTVYHDRHADTWHLDTIMD
jgi:hypothetical protein